MEDNKHRPQRGIPRLSRLPVPRASHDANTADANTGDRQSAFRNSGSLVTASLRLKGTTPLSEAPNRSLTPSLRLKNHPSHVRSPIYDLDQSDQVASLEATPPRHDPVCVIEGDENATADDVDRMREKRKPRPSLSERTVETLSQIPPSPSPSRRRSSITGQGSGIQPPSRPSSSLRSPRHSTSLRLLRPLSPSKLHHASTTIATATTTHGNGKSQEGASKVSSYAHRAKTIHDVRGPAPKTPTKRPSLSSVFGDPTKGNIYDKKATIKSHTAQRATSISESRPCVKNATVSRPTIKPPRTPVSSQRAVSQKITDPSAKPKNEVTPPKSSLTLRETIAKAKAAKRDAAKLAERSASGNNTGLVTASPSDYEFADTGFGGSQRTVQGGVTSALTSGTLNLAGMSLTSLPEAVRKMYDFDSNSKVMWSEAVDLTKLVLSDNELEELPDDAFPDWSIEELEDDADKTNQFGGLQILELRGNRLEKLPLGLRRLQQLHTLVISNNRLKNDAWDIICQLPNLKELNLAGNNLQGEIPASITQLVQLQSLDVHSNRLSLLPNDIDGLQHLQRLNLSDNAFKSVPLSKLQRLSLLDLNVSKNMISGNLVTGDLISAKLSSLNVSFNQIELLCDGRFECPQLQTLACDNNQLQALPSMTALGSLMTLTTSENKLTTLPDGFTGLPCLRSVDFSFNQLRILDPQIGEMGQLTTFNVAGNPLRERKYLSMNTDDMKTDLARWLTMNQPTIEDGHPDTTNVPLDSLAGTSTNDSSSIYKADNGVLNLSSKNILAVDMSLIELSQPVHTIRLSNNELTAFPIELLTHSMVNESLRSLDLSHNQSMHPTAYLTTNISLPALQSLYIVSTGLTSLEALTTHLSAPALRELNISCHRMTGPMPSAKSYFPSLTTLLATDNWFTSVTVEDVRGLEVIDISNNDIDHLPPKIGELGNLEGTKAVPGRLRTFECSGNKFRVPRRAILERGTEAVLRDLRRMVPAQEVGAEWHDEH